MCHALRNVVKIMYEAEYIDVYIQGHTSRKWWNQDSAPLHNILLMYGFPVVGSEMTDLALWNKSSEAPEVNMIRCVGWYVLVNNQSGIAQHEPAIIRHFKEVILIAVLKMI